jgi:hypothetical protein
MKCTLDGFVEDLPPADKEIDSAEYWQDMPEFVQENKEGYKSFIVHFETKEAWEQFQRTKRLEFKGTITDKTKYCWQPEHEIQNLAEWVYACEDKENP